MNGDGTMVANRVRRTRMALDEHAVRAFFEGRAARFDPRTPYVSIMYQDSNPDLAMERDRVEKAVVFPLLRLSSEDRVLDVGCGIGRWADGLAGQVARYHGTDRFESLIRIARERFSDHPSVSFQAIPAQDIDVGTLNEKPPFSLFLFVGIMMYMNDQDCRNVLDAVTRLSAGACRILVREPIGVEERLTLDRVWSEELRHEYSAIYRTREEFLALFEATLFTTGFRVAVDNQLFPEALNNRSETRQHLFILTRGDSE